MRQCGKCGEVKELTEYYKSKRPSYCKKCHSAASYESAKKNKAERLKKWLETDSHECKRCGVVKSTEEFYWKSGNTSYCKVCYNGLVADHYRRNKGSLDQYRKQWVKDQRKADPEKYQQKDRARTLRKFGESPDWFDKTFEAQGGVCAICKREEKALHQSGKVVSLSIDHDHITNKARGLLCRLCNHALHNLDRDPDWPYRAVEYLEKFK